MSQSGYSSRQVEAYTLAWRLSSCSTEPVGKLTRIIGQVPFQVNRSLMISELVSWPAAAQVRSTNTTTYAEADHGRYGVCIMGPVEQRVCTGITPLIGGIQTAELQ